MTKSLSKVNLASLKVLYTLQLLFERDLSIDELIKYYELYHNEYNTNFVMSKYINTCRYCGIDIKRINNKYTILNFPIGINFTETELGMFKEMKNCCEKMKSSYLAKNMQNFLNKINRRVERPISPVSTTVITDPNINTFERARISEQKIKIYMKNKTSYICEPVDVTIGEERVVLTIFDGNESKELNPKDIEQIKILPQRSKQRFIPTTVLFELKAKLAKKYQIRENEQLLKINNNGDFVITNRFEDKTKLLHRLMRYGELCKILSPKVYVNDMKDLIEKTLENYS